MTKRIAINGFGRTGRSFLRAATDNGANGFEIVAVNDVTTAGALAELLRFDSTYGMWSREITATEDTISVAGHEIHVSSGEDPAALPWHELGVDIVIESTGRFLDRSAAAAHLTAGAKKVIVTAPVRNADATIVFGVNEDTYSPESDHVVSNASCTTNCLAPMIAVLHQAFGVRRALMTTIHGYTGDQNLLDGPHTDPRRARAAAVNMIPTSTGAATAVGRVLPELAGRLHGVAVRVPIENGSLTDVTAQLETVPTAAQVNQAFSEAANGFLKRYVRYTEAPIVSRDIIGDPASCVLDASLTIVDGHMAKVFGWYDNEWGYANRTLDLATMIARTL